MHSDALIPPATALGDVADLVAAIAWPFAAIALFLILREPLTLLVRRIGASAQSLSIGPGGVTVDFGAAVEHVKVQSSTVLDDLRTATPQIADSGADNMFEQLALEDRAPYLLVDLGDGHDWLTSRLYLFASMLITMRGTRTLVFVETLGGIRGRFVGIAASEHVRWALAHACPWLEADFADAYAQSTSLWRTQPGGGTAPREPLVLDVHGRLNRQAARQLVQVFLRDVQLGPPPHPDAPDWVNEPLDGAQLVEHARWLNGADLDRLLGPALDRFAYLAEAIPRSDAELAAATLRMHGHDVIAVLDEQHRFRGAVVDRTRALEALAKEFAEGRAV